MRILGFLPTIALAAALSACATAQGSGDMQTATLTEFCNSRAETECNSQIVASCQVKDAATCVAQRAASCQTDAPQGTVYNPAAAPACLSAVATAYATATLTAAALAAVATACEPVFSGPGAARAPCSVDYDCDMASGLRCLTPANEMQSKCLVPNMVPAGGPCPGEADVCSGTYACDPMSLVCVAEGGAGSMCSIYQPCMQGFTCPDSPFDAYCSPLAVAGTPCLAPTDCASNLCDKATGQSQGVCADQVQLTSLDSMCAAYQ